MKNLLRKTDLFSESDRIKHRKLLDRPTGLILSHWRPSYVRQLVDQLVRDPQMSPEKSASQSPAAISRLAQPTPDSVPLENTLCGVGARAEWGDLLQCTLLTAPQLPIKANLTQSTRPYTPSEGMQQSVHNITYEVVFPNSGSCSDQASRSNYQFIRHSRDRKYAK